MLLLCQRHKHRDRKSKVTEGNTDCHPLTFSALGIYSCCISFFPSKEREKEKDREKERERLLLLAVRDQFRQNGI